MYFAKNSIAFNTNMSCKYVMQIFYFKFSRQKMEAVALYASWFILFT